MGGGGDNGAAGLREGRRERKEEASKETESKSAGPKERVQRCSVDNKSIVAASRGPVASFAHTVALVPRIITYNVHSLSYYSTNPENLCG